MNEGEKEIEWFPFEPRLSLKEWQKELRALRKAGQVVLKNLGKRNSP